MDYINEYPIERFRYLVHRNGVITDYKRGRFLKPTKSNNGRYTVGLNCETGGIVRRYVHRLVAQCFIPNPMGHAYVHHMDGNMLNNDVSNLIWMDNPWELPDWLR